MVCFTGGVLALWALVTCAGAQQQVVASVSWEPVQQSVLLEEVLREDSVVYGFYNHSLEHTGWGVLELRAGYGQTEHSDDITYFLAGYLEGYLTAPQMASHYLNMHSHLIKDKKVLKPQLSSFPFLSDQDSWAREQVRLNENNDPLWQQVGLTLAQLDGLHAGAAHWARSRHKRPLSVFAVQFLNAIGDLLDLIPVLRSRSSFFLDSFRMPGMGHCSALIKMLPGYENLLFAHSSWYTYAASMRIYKHWDFKQSNSHTGTGKVSFSSYPGLLSSLDDFYLLGNGLLITQTTNSVFNTSLYALVTPEALLAWQRVRLANSLAHTGEEWAQVFSRYNSGTYNNQYMVVDLNRVLLGREIKDGALTVVEQIPGLVVYSDQTQALRHGYWSSYNIPFHSDIYTLSGYGVMWEIHWEDFSYDLCPRAKIFRRDQAKVTDLASLKYIMRYNDCKNDPYSKRHPCKTICCRNDLRLRRPFPGGCFDTKVTDYHMARKLVAEAVNSPTTQNGLPPFTWSRFNQTAHHGLPLIYNFSFVTMQPSLFLP
uniref:Phospholipase B-like n=1 Tax=Astyanax mexicanus TaxID=7994 RepID=A0A8B9K679_ASTMX